MTIYCVTLLQDLHIVWYVVLMFTNGLSSIDVSKNRTGWKFYQMLTMSGARTMETWKLDDFLQKWKRWSVLCYMDQLLANQIAGKPVHIICHIIIVEIIATWFTYCITMYSFFLVQVLHQSEKGQAVQLKESSICISQKYYLKLWN